MSAPMKKHHTSQAVNACTFIYQGKLYSVPKTVLKLYEKKSLDDSVSSDTVFVDLLQKQTRSGTLLKGLRARENLTQKEFAAKISVTQANLSGMERGHRAIGKEIAKRIEKVFGVNYRYFLE